MNPRRVPNLRIALDESSKTLRMTDSQGKPFDPIPCELNASFANQYRDSMRRGLKEMKDRLRGGNLTIEQASTALAKLNKRGLSVLGFIFGGDSAKKLSDIFQLTCPAWFGPEPANITIVANVSSFIPIEFLPVFDLSRWPITDSLESLNLAVKRFPGFSAIIKREFPNVNVNHDLILVNEPKLPVRCFVNFELLGVQSEVKFFTDNQEHIDMDGPWPDKQWPGEEFCEVFAKYLQFADEKFIGGVRAPIDQIQHFICHCDIDPEFLGESMLRFSKGNKIKIYELLAEITIPSTKKKPISPPLIFLNACGSSHVDPMSVTSFPQFFLEKNGNRGFIGTEINVPDLFAAEFSQCFYARLLQGDSVGRALHAAKWMMLTKRNNPLGIIYTLYANPDLHVSNKVETVNPVDILD